MGTLHGIPRRSSGGLNQDQGRIPVGSYSCIHAFDGVLMDLIPSDQVPLFAILVLAWVFSSSIYSRDRLHGMFL